MDSDQALIVLTTVADDDAADHIAQAVVVGQDSTGYGNPNAL
jgi:hypothetical protein